jgi:uncharacterized RDD family membrane protein YckC
LAAAPQKRFVRPLDLDGAAMSEATSEESAGIVRRVAALVYDSFLLVALLMVFTGASLFFTHGNAVMPENTGAWVYVYRSGLVLVIAAYFVGNWIRSGQTLGMRAWRIRVVDERGGRLTLGPACVRFVLAVAAWSPLGLGVLWMYADPAHLAIHDRLAKTRLLRLTRS